MNVPWKTNRTKGSISKWIAAFMLAKRTQNTAPGTMKWYSVKLQLFQYYAVHNELKLETMEAGDIRNFMEYLAHSGHNPGGCHGAFRALRSFMYWMESELDGDWKAPIRKCHPPKLSQELLPPVGVDVVKQLLETCSNDYWGKRDRSIILTLLDTGLRANELLSLNIDDVDAISGAVIVKKGKNGRTRVVFLGMIAKRSMRRYLKCRHDSNEALFVAKSGLRIKYSGLREMISRRSRLCGVDAPMLHSFRRAFVLEMLRNGCDLMRLKSMTGHGSYQVLERYMALNTSDLQQAHNAASPADRL